MGKAINVREGRRLVESHGVDKYHNELSIALEKRQVSYGDISIRDLYEVYCGRDALDSLDPRRKSGGRQLTEAADAVSSAAFTNITGQLLVNKVKDEYQTQTRLTQELYQEYPTNIMQGEKIPGIGGLGDVAEVVPEGKAFPVVGVNEEWVLAPTVKKRGFEVHVTREAVVQDLTGVLLARCGNGAKYLGITNEKRALDVVTGIVNNYSRNGTATNTYLTSGAYINQQANPLVNNPTYNSIQNIDTLVSNINDPNTGEPIAFDMSGLILIVPTALMNVAEVLISASQVRQLDSNALGAGAVATYAPTPIGGRPFRIASSPYIARRSGSNTTWFAGQPKNAFYRSVVWDIEQQDITATAGIASRMIVAAYQVSVADEYWVYEPRYMTKNT